MPSSSSGMTGDEIISYIKSWVGNQDSAFQSMLTTALPLAEYRFCKVHPWRFLMKQNLSLTVATGTANYNLSTSTIGYYMAAEDVVSVFSVTNNIYLKKVTLDELRRLDPNEDDGTAGVSYLRYWCPVGDNEILVYPPKFADTALKVDGKITPTALLTTSNYPTIPYRYQESFIQYLLSMALDRENDDRAAEERATAKALIKADIQSDLAGLGDTDSPRMRHWNEQRFDGAVVQVDPLNMLYSTW